MKRSLIGLSLLSLAFLFAACTSDNTSTEAPRAGTSSGATTSPSRTDAASTPGSTSAAGSTAGANTYSGSHPNPTGDKAGNNVPDTKSSSHATANPTTGSSDTTSASPSTQEHVTHTNGAGKMATTKSKTKSKSE